MLGLFSSAALNSEVETIVGEFVKTCPPPVTVGRKPMPKAQIESSLQVLYAQVADCVQKRRLGILGRARLAKALQTEMQRYKYPDELVSQLVSAVTVNALVR